jgi:hypothetical protein
MSMADATGSVDVHGCSLLPEEEVTNSDSTLPPHRSDTWAQQRAYYREVGQSDSEGEVLDECGIHMSPLYHGLVTRIFQIETTAEGHST